MSGPPGPGPSAFARAEGTGNRFLVWDRWHGAQPDEAEARAQEAALAPVLARAFGVDGLLTLARPRAGGDLRMLLHNADGGRPETCGNGLRVVVCAHAARRGPPAGGPGAPAAGAVGAGRAGEVGGIGGIGGVDRTGGMGGTRGAGGSGEPGEPRRAGGPDRAGGTAAGLRGSADGLARDGPAGGWSVETDAGPRAAWPLADADGAFRRARVSLGRPRLVAADVALDTAGANVLAHLVDVGNPHCVVFVGDLARVELARLGPALERHPRFPDRTNVEFVERTADGLRLLVWERGVGETASCGSGVVAAAFAARVLHGGEGPRRVATRGGSLRVSFACDGQALLEGAASVRPLTPTERATLGDLLAAHPGAYPR